MANGNLVTLAGLRALLASLQKDEFSDLSLVHHYTNLDGTVRYEVVQTRRCRDVTVHLYADRIGCSVGLVCKPLQVQVLPYNSSAYDAPSYAAKYFRDTRDQDWGVVESLSMHDPPLETELLQLLGSIHVSQHLQQCPCGEAYASPRDMCACCMMACTDQQLQEETCVVCYEAVPRMYSRRNDKCCGCYMHRRCHRALARRGMEDKCPHCRHCSLGSSRASSSGSLSTLVSTT